MKSGTGLLLLLAAGVGAIVLVERHAKAASAPAKIKASKLAASWPGFVVIDVAKWNAVYTPPISDAPFVAVGAAPAAALSQDPKFTPTIVGPLLTFLTSQTQRVWVGQATLDPTASQPESVLPIYVGNTPPAGYTEVTS